MSARLQLEALLELLEQDREFLDECVTWGLVERSDEGFDPADAERLRVARTLVRELEVNWPGVEIILRMRGDMVRMHAQVAELLALLARRR